MPFNIPLGVIPEARCALYIIYLRFYFQSLVVSNNTELLEYSIKMTIRKKLETIMATLEYHQLPLTYHTLVPDMYISNINSLLWLITYDIVSDFSDPKANIVLMNQRYNWKSNIKCSCNLQIPYNSRIFIDIT